MRVVFFGTPEFAVPSLRALLGEGFDVLAAVTQPDRPQGRSRSRAVPPPVKVEALAEAIPVFQPERPTDPAFLGRLRELAPDVGVVVAYGHILKPELLRQSATPVAVVDDELRRLVDDLFDTMRAAKGVGLAANQVGVARRVAVVDVGEEFPPSLVLINPRIVQASDVTETAEEGCLSIPDLYGEVERPLAVTLEALDRDGRPYSVEVSGFKARAAQHEIDHLDGILFLDHLSAVKRHLLVAKWKKSRKGKPGYVKDVTPEPAGEL